MTIIEQFKNLGEDDPPFFAMHNVIVEMIDGELWVKPVDPRIPAHASFTHVVFNLTPYKDGAIVACGSLTFLKENKAFIRVETALDDGS